MRLVAGDDESVMVVVMVSEWSMSRLTSRRRNEESE